jgi:hypothetical protein
MPKNFRSNALTMLIFLKNRFRGTPQYISPFSSKNMKKYIFIALVLLQTIGLMAQTSRFKDGETLNVWATSGLNMRDKPDAKAAKLVSIPYGAKVVVQPNIGVKIPFEVEEFKGFIVKGYWLLVKYGDKEGFVFDGFLSRLPAPIPTEQDLAIQTYLHQQIGEVGSQFNIGLFDKKLDKYRIADTNEKIEEKNIVGFSQKYKFNILLEKGGESSGNIKITITQLTPYEGYFLVKTYFYNAETDVFTFNKKDKSVNMNVVDGSGGCDFAIKQVGNKVVIDGYCGC